MKKLTLNLMLSMSLLSSSAFADSLKNSLTSIMKEKEEPGMVNLGNINLSAKPKANLKRSPNTVIAIVNGQNIIKKTADTYLGQRTQGKVTNFDALSTDQRTRLISELSLPILTADAAKKELTDLEKEALFSRTWMQKEARQIKISDDDVLNVYNQLKLQAKESNTTEHIYPFEKVKDGLKLQMVEKTMIDNLMKDVEIKVY